MIKLKTIISLIPSIIGLISGNLNNIPSNDDEFTFYVNPFAGGKEDLDTIKWFQRDEEYFLFLPSDTDRNNLAVYFDGAESIIVDSYTFYNGDITNAFNSKDTYTIDANNKPYKLSIYESENVPTMFLETKKPLSYINESKDNKCESKIRTYENGEMTLDSSLKHIKGRGNSTWEYDKKSYNIKFDKKTKLFGMAKAKKWSLLATYSDPILLKNPLSWELSDLMGIDYRSDYKFVNLYINGEYLGNYIVCEPIEIGENRVNIFDLSEATEEANNGADLETFEIQKSSSDKNYSAKQWVNIPNDPEDITGGYLLECEYTHRAVDNETSYFITARNQSIVIKEPEYASKKQVEYISNYFQEAEDAISSTDGYNRLGKHFTNYFDIDSLVDLYILLEISENSDAGKSSTFFYKDKGGKICAGPIWDSDTAFGKLVNTGEVLITDPSKWIVAESYYDDEPDNCNIPTIYNRLFKIRYFRDKVSERWSEIKQILIKSVLTNLVDNLANNIRKTAIMNACRWYGITNVEVFDLLVKITRDNLVSRVSYLTIGFSKHASYLFYDLNGGNGYCSEKRIMHDGEFAFANGPYHSQFSAISDVKDLLSFNEKVIVPVIPPKEGLVFTGWNTRKNGSGKTYLPGDPIFMYGTTTLYAQWKIGTGNEPDYTKPNIKDEPLFEFIESIFQVLKMLIIN